ncbi:MAG: hypothetical protein NVSMB55_08280 [Mycobacteriales bacterium]
MAVVVLDTTVLIDVLRGRPAGDRLLQLQRSGDQPATTAINVEEIVRGIRPAERDIAGTLFDGLLVLDIGRREAEQAGTWRREYAAKGRTLAQADCLIAATAAAAGARLATGNPKDFAMLRGAVDHWPVGS